MRAFRHVPVVVFALGALACTAILGGFEVGAGPGAGLEGGTGEGGPPPGDAANDVSIDAPADAPVSCVAPRVGCGSVCVDLDMNDKNCGVCGRGCLGGNCAARKCQAFLFAPRADVIPGTLAATDTDLFFATTANEVIQQPLAAGAAPITLAAPGGQVFGIAPLGGIAFFTTQIGAQWQLWKSTVGARSSGGMRNSGLGGRPVGLVAVPTAGNVFTLNATVGPPEAFTLTTCAASTPACFSNYPGTRPGSNIVAGNGFVFWTEQFGAVFETADGVGVKNTVSNAEGTATVAAWDGAALFWANNNTGKIRRSPFPNPAAADFRDIGSAADDMLVDGTYLYYSQSNAVGASDLFATPKAGAATVAPIRMATGAINQIVQTATGIYWANAAGVHGIRKP